MRRTPSASYTSTRPRSFLDALAAPLPGAEARVDRRTLPARPKPPRVQTAATSPAGWPVSALLDGSNSPVVFLLHFRFCKYALIFVVIHSAKRPGGSEVTPQFATQMFALRNLRADGVVVAVKFAAFKHYVGLDDVAFGQVIRVKTVAVIPHDHVFPNGILVRVFQAETPSRSLKAIRFSTTRFKAAPSAINTPFRPLPKSLVPVASVPM